MKASIHYDGLFHLSLHPDDFAVPDYADTYENLKEVIDGLERWAKESISNLQTLVFMKLASEETFRNAVETANSKNLELGGAADQDIWDDFFWAENPVKILKKEVINRLSAFKADVLKKAGYKFSDDRMRWEGRAKAWIAFDTHYEQILWGCGKTLICKTDEEDGIEVGGITIWEEFNLPSGELIDSIIERGSKLFQKYFWVFITHPSVNSKILGEAAKGDFSRVNFWHFFTNPAFDHWREHHGVEWKPEWRRAYLLGLNFHCKPTVFVGLGVYDLMPVEGFVNWDKKDQAIGRLQNQFTNKEEAEKAYQSVIKGFNKHFMIGMYLAAAAAEDIVPVCYYEL